VELKPIAAVNKFRQDKDMSRVEEIREAIASLTLEERAELMAGLAAFEDDEWDRQMKRDATAGKFAAMNDKAGRDVRSGHTRALEDVIKGA
jgi:hypothetical protein